MSTAFQQSSQTSADLSPAASDLSAAYSAKTDRYFTGARRSFLNQLPQNKQGRLLEVGCGSGSTAAAALAEGKCGFGCGIELCEGPAAAARQRLNQVLVGNVEEMALDLPPASFDVLLMSEVLEHLRDPSAVLTKLKPLLKPGAIVLAGSPNVCHYSILLMLLRGRWDYEREGVMDETHARWFTPATYRELFEKSGYTVDHVRPAFPLRPKARILNSLLLGKFQHLFHSQIELRAHRP